MVVREKFLVLLLKATGGATSCKEWWERWPAWCSKAWLSDISSFEAIATTNKMVVRLPCVAHQRNRSCGWILLGHLTPDCCWQLGLRPFVFSEKLHHLGRPMLLGVPASAERPRVAAETGGLVRSRDESPSYKPEQKVKLRSGVRTGGPKLQCKELSWRINSWENSILFSIAFSLLKNEYLPLAPKKLIPYLYPHLCTCFVLSEKINVFSSGKVVCTFF